MINQTILAQVTTDLKKYSDALLSGRCTLFVSNIYNL